MSALKVLAVGITVVLGVLAMLWAAMAIVGTGFRLAEAALAKRNAAAPPEPEPVPVAEPGIPPEHLAAIAAAVATIIEAPHRIVRVMAPTNTKPSWTLAGRLGSIARGAKG